MKKDNVEPAPASIRRTLFGTTEWVTDRESRAHAMKNCLSVINGIATLFERELSETSRSRLARLEAASAKLLAFIEDELASVGAAPGHAGLPRSLEVPTLFESVRALLCDRAEAAGVTVALDCEPATFTGMASDLEEALFNLIANAIEATPAGGSVEITTRVDDNGDHVWTVDDSGDGIPREILERAGDIRRTGRKGGTGLGIAIAAAVVRAHGGLLNIEAFAGHGTAVTVWLPGAQRDSYEREIPTREE